MNLSQFTDIAVAVAAIAHALDKIILWAQALLPEAEKATDAAAADLPKLAPILAAADAKLKSVEAVPAPEVVA